MNNPQLAHVWAQLNRASTHHRIGSNMYFEQPYNGGFGGNTIYSYGPHFPIARHEVAADGLPCVLMATQSYSITTAKHIGYVRHATSHLRVFYVHDVMACSKAAHRGNHGLMRDNLQDEIAKLAKGRSRLESRFEYYREQIRHANAYSKAFKLGRRALPVPETLKEAFGWSANYIAKYNRQQAALRLKAKQKAEQEAAYMAVEIENWKAGDRNVYLPYQYSGNAFLRLKDAETVETSQRASFPLSHAKKAWRIIKKCHDEGQEFHPNGHTLHIGHFTVSLISKTGDVTAGCHHIKYEECARFAELQGWE